MDAGHPQPRTGRRLAIGNRRAQVIHAVSTEPETNLGVSARGFVALCARVAGITLVFFLASSPERQSLRQ